MAADPKTIPAAVVSKIRDIVDRHKGTEPFEVTGTLKIDPVTGKILDAFFIGGWVEVDGELQPRYATVHQCEYVDGVKQFSVYGKSPKPTVHTE